MESLSFPVALTGSPYLRLLLAALLGGLVGLERDIHGRGAGLRVDPSRIAAQIVTGIGMAAGAGYFTLALLVTALSLLSLVVLNRVERHYATGYYRILEVQAPLATDPSAIIDILKRDYLKILHLDLESSGSPHPPDPLVPSVGGP